MSASSALSTDSMSNEQSVDFLQPRILDTQLSLPSTLAAALEEQLCILHPGYDNLNTLLQLPTTDHGAVDYNTTLTMCGIICGNTYLTGWFAKDRSRLQRIVVGTPLTGTVYYFVDRDTSCRTCAVQVDLCALCSC